MKIQHPVFLKKSKKCSNYQSGIVSQQNGAGGGNHKFLLVVKIKTPILLHLFIKKNQKEETHPQSVYLSFPFHQEEKHILSHSVRKKENPLHLSKLRGTNEKKGFKKIR